MINQIYQAEVECHYGSKGSRVYSSVLKMMDRSIVPTGNESSSNRSTYEKKAYIINQMLINFRGVISMPVFVVNSYVIGGEIPSNVVMIQAVRDPYNGGMINALSAQVVNQPQQYQQINANGQNKV